MFIQMFVPPRLCGSKCEKKGSLNEDQKVACTACTTCSLLKVEKLAAATLVKFVCTEADDLELLQMHQTEICQRTKSRSYSERSHHLAHAPY